MTKHWPRQLLRAALIPNRMPLALPLAEVQGMAAAAVDRWYRRSRLVNPEPATPPIPTDAQRQHHRSDSGSRTEVVTVDVTGTIALSEPPPGTVAMSVLVTRGHAAIGRLQVQTGGRPPSDRQLRETVDRRAGRPRPRGVRGPGRRRRSAGGRLACSAASLRRDAETDPRKAALQSVDRRRQSGSPRRAPRVPRIPVPPPQPARGRDRGRRQQPGLRAHGVRARRSPEHVFGVLVEHRTR